MKQFEITSCGLHILAMALMLCDHIWATLLPQYAILTCIGRIAFPIFAFLLVEGFTKTKDLKKYFLRILVFALISEIPFNLVYSNSVFYPYHQNVLFTYLLGIIMLWIMDKCKQFKYFKYPLWLLITIAFFAIGYITMVDFYGDAFVMISLFYVFKERTPLNMVLLTLLMYYVNAELLGGYYYDVVLFGHHFELIQQSLATLALIPIFLYKGNKGYTSKGFKYFCYAFYPAHLTILYIIFRILY